MGYDLRACRVEMLLDRANLSWPMSLNTSGSDEHRRDDISHGQAWSPPGTYHHDSTTCAFAVRCHVYETQRVNVTVMDR